MDEQHGDLCPGKGLSTVAFVEAEAAQGTGPDLHQRQYQLRRQVEVLADDVSQDLRRGRKAAIGGDAPDIGRQILTGRKEQRAGTHAL